MFERLIVDADCDGSSSKTSPDSTPATQGEILQRWLVTSLGAPLTFQGRGGKTPELRPAQEGWSSGAVWTVSGVPWRKGASVCSLSQILETGPIDRRYFLSAKACRGILRRAWRRGRDLPHGLLAALVAKAFGDRLQRLFGVAGRLGRLRSQEASPRRTAEPEQTTMMLSLED